MIYWFIVGLLVWIICILFMMAILKVGHRTRGHGYEQKLCFRSRVNAQNIEDSIKKEVKKTTRTRRNKCMRIFAHICP